MSALNSSVVSAATTDGVRLFQWGIVLGKKRILQGITISLGPAILWVVWWPGRSCTLRRGQVLVFINRHSPTMNLVEEKQRGLMYKRMRVRSRVRFPDFISFFSNIPWKWNNLVSLRPNYFIFIEYLKNGGGGTEGRSSEPSEPLLDPQLRLEYCMTVRLLT